MAGMITGKKWWQSKTIWVNLIGFVVVIAQYASNTQLVDPRYIGLVLTVANIVLRFITNTGLTV